MRILAVSPHPDDVDVATSGFLCLAADRGHAVTLAVATNGETGGDPAVRRDEQLRAAAVYGAETVWLELGPDTQMQVDAQTIHRLERLLADVEPDLVMVNAVADSHQDHRALHQAVLSAARYHPSVICYETPTTLHFDPSLYVDVAGVLRRKRAVVAEHRSQLGKPRSIAQASRALYRFRGWQGRVLAAEGFEVIRLGGGALL